MPSYEIVKRYLLSSGYENTNKTELNGFKTGNLIRHQNSESIYMILEIYHLRHTKKTNTEYRFLVVDIKSKTLNDYYQCDAFDDTLEILG